MGVVKRRRAPDRRHVDPDGRRAADKWGRRVERACLGLAIVFIFIGFKSLEGKQRQIDAQAKTSQASRAGTGRLICRATNNNAAAVNVAIDYIDGLIVSGTKQSRAFEHVFKQLGLPPYKDRLAQAERQAAGLRALRVRPLACDAFVARITTPTPVPAP